MAIPILNHLDLRGVSELRNALLHKTTSGSAANVEGKIIYDTGSDTIKFYNGSAWISLGAETNTTYSTSVVSDSGIKLRLTGANPTTTDDIIFTGSTGITISRTDANTIDVAGAHDSLSGFVANEHIDWTAGSAGTVHATNVPTLNQNTTGSAATLTTPRTIGGVSFNGSANIDLPGVNAAGNQNTSGTAANLSGTPNVSVGTIASSNITTTGYLRGPATFTIDPATHADNTGTVVIAGNLQVDGTTTTINSTTVSIDDLNFSIATDAADSAAANGAGITIGGAAATLIYTHATTSWDMNKPLNVTGNIGVTGTVDGVDIAARDAVLTSTTTTANAAQTAAEVGTLIDARSSAHTITGDASATEFTITYGFTAAAVNDVIIQVVCSYASDTDYDGDTVYAETERHSTTQCKIKFATAPASGHTYRVLCFKVA